jgi:PEGA domain-containing protein
MSAPSADFSALGASTSSSGYTDGLGRRALAFDREDGTMLERLVVRAELSAFERSLRDRVERLGAMDDERLAKPRSIERGDDGSLVVLSEFVPGSRLSDVLDTTWAQGTVPGVDVALGYLLDVLPALCGLHAGAGFSHGAISPGRTVLTPAGQVVLLDGIFGDALSRLQCSRRRLWDEFAVAMPPSAGPARFDAAADIAQAVLSAVMLVLGRPIADYEYPDAIPSLLVEVVDVAQIRGSAEFAAALQKFLQRSLPLPGRRPYTAADDALIDARDLARALGGDVCRRALLEFIEQVESGGQISGTLGAGGDAAAYGDEYTTRDQFGDEESSTDTDDGDELGVELDLDGTSAVQEDTVYDLSEESEPAPSVDEAESSSEPVGTALTESASESVTAISEALPEVAFEEPSREPELGRDAFEAATAYEQITEDVPAPTEEILASTPVEPTPLNEDAFRPATIAPEPSEPSADYSAFETAPAAEPGESEESEPEQSDSEQSDSEQSDSEQSEPEPASAVETTEETGGSRRRKRTRSVRSRKDKLRSTAQPQPLHPPTPPPALPPPPATPPPSAKPAHGAWLVEPNRAASFEPPVPGPPAAPPVFAAPPPPPPIALAPPPPPAPVPLAVSPPPPAVRPVVPPPPPAPIAPPLAPPRPPIAAAPTPVPLKLKNEPPSGYAPPRKARPEPAEDLYSSRTIASGPVQEPSAFPWKLASAAVVLMVVGVVVGRAYLPDRSEPDTKSAAAAVSAPPATPPSTPVATAKTGRVQVTTDPVGARVLLDGKHVGESPLTLEVPVGRHTVTMAYGSGSVRRVIRVEAGKAVTIEAPIFSGWVDVVAPIVLDVAEGGRSIGTTEQSRMLLPPGRHELTFSNKDLDYTSSQAVDIEPGEIETVRLDPRGTLNLNASPWAEVWINGKKVGDTPMANLSYPLGTHEIVFKHPQFGERRRTTTLRAGAPVPLSVDMSKQ